MKVILKFGVSFIFVLLFSPLSAQKIVDKDSTFLISVFTNKLLDFSPNLTNTSNRTIFNRFDADKLPLFCKIEHQIEKSSKIAFRFRLGEVNYVNMLENKK
jgi:hypothetical protein